MISAFESPSEDEKFFFQKIGMAINQLTILYREMLIAGNGNSEENCFAISSLMGAYVLNNLVKIPTYFKPPDNPSSIDTSL